jgi:GeoRSP system SPASM domain protein
LHLQEAAERIPALNISLGGKKLVVHDFFLWRILRDSFPNETGERVEFSGCQAGSALAHVDWEGNVYPCDSLPVRLGNLQETPFAEIWRSPMRRQVLAAIRSLPAPCGSCDSLKGCLSGCRGLAYLASGTLESADPCCTVETPRL